MSVEIDSARPNIRVQIHNAEASNDDGKMEVDNEEGEEGEITEDGDEEMLLEPTQEVSSKPISREVRGVFTTGINVFDKEEQKKLEERARRFALKPEELKNFNDKDLQELHKSLGINPGNESEIKFNVLHLYGVDGMNAEDILKIFENYAPDGIEYIENNICNVVWLDNISAARALHYTSKPVNGMPARDAADIFPKEFLEESTDVTETEGTGRSILLNNDREVELRQDDEVISPQNKVHIKGAVDISEIKIVIPPGYWRLGLSSNSKCLLIRFGLISDKISYRSEPFSKYYKKIGGSKNIIPENKKNEMKSIFERNKELAQDKKNPWGSIAKDWDKDSRYRERSPIMYDKTGLEDHPLIEIKNQKMLARLGKRKVEEETLDDEVEFIEKVVEPKKTKMPRMKMYADEEEERIKRKKMLQKIKHQSQKIEEADKKVDLRNMLGRTGNVKEPENIVKPIPEMDLGSRLKNRSQKMIFAIERDEGEIFPEDPVSPREVEQPDIRSLLLERRNDRERRIKIERKVTPPRRRSVEKSHKSRRRDDNREKTHHSDGLYSDRLDRERSRRSRVSKHYRSSSYDRHVEHKPRSRVVIRPARAATPKKPTVASTVWSKVKKSSGSSEESSSESDSDDSEESDSESSSSSSESDSDSDSDDSDDSSSSSSSDNSQPSKKTTTKSLKGNNVSSRKISRPGFEKTSSVKDRLSDKKAEGRSPLKITTTNNRYKSRR